MTTLQGRYCYLHFTYGGNQDSEKVQESLPKFMLAQRLEPTRLSTILLPSGILYVAGKGVVGRRKYLERVDEQNKRPNSPCSPKPGPFEPFQREI